MRRACSMSIRIARAGRMRIVCHVHAYYMPMSMRIVCYAHSLRMLMGMRLT